MKEYQKLILLVLIFLCAYFMPVEKLSFQKAIVSSFQMLKIYAREHVLFCLVPAFFIAGAISFFVNKGEIMKYLGPDAPKFLSYTIASLSGSILAVCSCTVLPLFGGIWKKGAGIGPATAFLYSGPAINILAMVLTARVLGLELGLARIIGAVGFAFIIGLIMSFIFGREKSEIERTGFAMENLDPPKRKPIKDIIFFISLILILIFATWGKPGKEVGFFNFIYSIHWYLAGLFLILLLYTIFSWIEKDERIGWVQETFSFVKMIFPLLIGGVLVSGFLFGVPGESSGVIPANIIEKLLGGNSIFSNLFASVFGALMYFATLTEIPILQGLLGLGMGKGPALTLLLAGPALSLPNMIVITSFMGRKKAFTYFGLVIVMSTITGFLYGLLF
ncbi:MAG: permease [Thermoanaerobaculia bacterium]